MTDLLRDLELARDDDGTLLVRWIADEPLPVDIAVGSSPLGEDHTPFTTTTSTTVRLDGVGVHRAYVSVAPAGRQAVVVAERRVPFAGITNLRDLGGYATASGGSTRWGTIFRADALHKLTAADLELFRGLGAQTVYDLRGDAERTEFPGPVESLHVPIVGRPPGVTPPAPPAEMTVRDGELLLRDMYVGILDHSAEQLAAILRGLAGAAAVPAIFHCHGGKDRTGVVAAVLLRCLDVDRETVLDDYEATRRYRTIDDQQDSLANMLAQGVSPEAAAGVLGTPRWAMAAALDAIDEVHGGIEAYVTTRLGLSPDELAALRERLVAAPHRA
jgi:protein-tyrosine phosphatase